MEIISFTQPNDNDKNLYITKISKHFNDADLQVLKCCLGFRCLYSGAQLITILRLCLRFSKCLPLLCGGWRSTRALIRWRESLSRGCSTVLGGGGVGVIFICSQ